MVTRKVIIRISPGLGLKGHILKCEGGTGGSIAPFLRGAKMHSMNLKDVETELLSKIVGLGRWSLYSAVLE